MRTPISNQSAGQIVSFAAAMLLIMTLMLIGVFSVVPLSQAHAASSSVAPAAAHVIAPVTAPAPAAAVPDDVDIGHYESATHTAGVYAAMPIGAAGHDPESAAGTTGTLMYAER